MDRRTLGTLVVLAAGVALTAAVFGRSPRAAATERVPTDPAEILERSPGGQGEVAALRRVLAVNPKSVPAATRLARIHIRLARERSDPRFLGRAQAVLEPWKNDPTAPPEILVLRATIAQSLHDFPAALVDLDRAIAIDPGD